MVSILSKPSEEKARSLGVRSGFVFVQPNVAELTEIAALLDSAKLRPVIEKVFPLAEARQAQKLSQAGHVHGKLVLQAA